MTEELDNLGADLAKLKRLMEDFESMAAPLMEQKKDIDRQKLEIKKEYEQKILDLNTQFNQFNEALWEIQKKQRSLKLELESKERQLEQQRRLEASIKAAEEIAADWEKVTAGLPWREFAMDHQISGAKRITMNKRMILADTMGLGKTLTSLMAMDYIQAATRNARPDNPYMEELYPENTGTLSGQPIKGTGVIKPCGYKILYVAPATMMGNVKREVKRWAPHRSVVTLGGATKAQRRFLVETMKSHNEYVVLINYEAWRKDNQLIEDLIDIEFDTVIVDEAHNVKDRKTNAYRGLNRIITQSNDGMGIPFVVPMTGTPILNRPQELFSLLTLVDWRHYHSENYFLRDFCRQDIYTGKWEFRPGGLESLGRRIGNLFLRRTKEQAGIKLPPKTILVHEIEMDPERYPEQARARAEMRKWGSIILDESSGKALQAQAEIAVYTRLRQIETWPAGIELKDPQTKEIVLKVDIEESQKIDELIGWENGQVNEWGGLLPEIIFDERAAVFSQFKAPLREIARRCEAAGIKAVVLDGDTPDKVRDEILQDFDAHYTPERSDAKWDVVLCNYKVGGVGANFTAATQMFILDSEWNPGKRDQAIDRLHRIGQDKPVTIHKLVMNTSIDSWMEGIMEQKERMIGGFESMADQKLSDLLREALDKGEI